MDNSKIICFDVETTGLNFMEDEILSLSIIDGNGKVLFNNYIKPEKKSEWPEAEKIHHITPDMVAKEKTLTDYKDTIEKIFANAELIVGYNSDYFDMSMLHGAGIDTGSAETFDVMLEFATIYGVPDYNHGGYKWQKLCKCADYYGYEQSGEYHDSLEDVRATMFCFKKIMENRSIESDKSDIKIDDLVVKGEPFKDVLVSALEESIKKYGILEPIKVFLNDEGKYEVIDGLRRIRACQKLGIETIPIDRVEYLKQKGIDKIKAEANMRER